MTHAPIRKCWESEPVKPNFCDYAMERRRFDWAQARERLAGLPGGGINIAWEAVGRHVSEGRGAHVALRWLGKKGERLDVSYGELHRRVNRFANVLDVLGVQPGQTVFALAGRIVELYVAALGTLAHRSVFCPLFSAFGPEPIQQRMAIGEAVVLVTTSSLYRRKVDPIRHELPHLRHVLIAGEDPRVDTPTGTMNLARLMAESSDAWTIPPTSPEDLALLHFTSGTTGMPKGAMHVHEAVVVHHISGHYALDLHPEDIFWCTADPGWVTGTSYGIISPLTHGCTNIVFEGEFSAEQWYSILQNERVTNWYTAPTAIRMMMKLGTRAVQPYDISSLRHITSVGEPLNAECVLWGQAAFGRPIHDNWWQTETGGIMIANYAAMEIRPGSMGRPLPGIEAAIVHRTPQGVTVVERPNEEGELALRAGWPSMFRGYLNNQERYASCFQDGWYLTSDIAERDEDGYFWFVGRADDVIKSAGHLIGPFEVESALMEHPAVAEAGVIGKPDDVAGQIVKAFVALRAGHDASSELEKELLGFGRKKLGAAVAPKEIEIVSDLPKTRSGKIMRRLLKARELGLPEGDISTLEFHT